MKTLKSTAAAASDRRDPAVGSSPATSPLIAKPLTGAITRSMQHCTPLKAEHLTETLPTAAADASGMQHCTPVKAQHLAETLPTAAADASGAVRKQCRIKKKRSLTELIEEMDQVPNNKKSEPRKPHQRSVASSKCKRLRDRRLAVVDEEAGFRSTRRERKKSRYLSPPYIFSSGFCMRVSQKEPEPEAVKNVSQASAAPKNTDTKSPKKVTKNLLCSQSKSKNVSPSSKFTTHSVSPKSKASKKATKILLCSQSKSKNVPPPSSKFTRHSVSPKSKASKKATKILLCSQSKSKNVPPPSSKFTRHSVSPKSKASKKATKILLCSQSKSKNAPPSSKFTRHSASTKSKESKKATEASCTRLTKLRTITKCTYRPPKGEGVEMTSPMFKIDGVHAYMRSPLFKIDSVPVTKIVSEFLLTTVNPLHLKWRGLAKTVRGFFELYRSSVYLNGSKFDAYREHLINCGEIDGQSASKETIDTLKYGKSKGRKKKKKDVGDNVLVTVHSEQKKVGPKRQDGVVGVSHLESGYKRKTRNDTTNVEHPLNLDLLQLEGAEAPKKRKKSNAYTCKTRGSGHESIGSVDTTNKRKMMPKGEEVSSLIIPDELRPMFVGCQEGDKLDHMNGKDAPETLEEVNNGMKAGETKCRRQKSSFAHEGPAEILLTFAPGITLPSKGQIISTFSKYGHLIEAQTELLKESGCASVVFARTSDAEKALDSRDFSRAFGFPVPSYRLRHLPGSFAISPPHMVPTVKPSLFSVKNNLETMISVLTGPTDESKPEAKEKLAGQMRDLLKKVNKKLGDRARVIYRF